MTLILKLIFRGTELNKWVNSWTVSVLTVDTIPQNKSEDDVKTQGRGHNDI
jgi:hypothetical protein